MRTSNSIKNLTYAFVGQFIGIIVSLIARIFFIKILSEEYLGLNSLFTNILTILSLTELGFGTAMCCQLYKPLSKNKKEEIKSLMQLYKKIYIFIGVSIIFLGILTIPIYPFFINDIPDISSLDVIYFLFVVNTAATYFFSYKKVLIISDQKRYISTFYRYLFYIILNILQIIILIITKNYIFYLLIQTILILIENLLVSRKADKIYPYLKETNIQKVSTKNKKEIAKNVKAMFYHKFGGTVLNSTDNIVISKVIGLTAVGLYSNYYLIINALNLIISQIFNSLIASIGSLDAEEDKDKMTTIFDRIFFLDFWIHIVCTICLIILLNPFIELWIGEKFLLNFFTVVILGVNFFIFGMRRTAMSFREATGNYFNDRFSPILESIINVIISLIMAKYLGIAGVFLGTIISSLSTNFWLEPLVVCRASLNKSIIEYFKTYFKYTIVGVFIAIITIFMSNFIQDGNYILFLLKAIICFTIPNIFLLLIFYRTENFKYYKNLVFENILKIKK